MHIDDIIWEIDGLPGMDEFKALCHRLELAANNARGNSLGRIPLPNLIFAAAPGCGTTLHIRLLTELLKTLRLLPFTGEDEYGKGRQHRQRFCFHHAHRRTGQRRQQQVLGAHLQNHAARLGADAC